ncbi:MAG: hypothetical protein OEZ36_13190, partial [Spirochaetota bacterium]|nr:hypothetical protein [Spirochaetota bacterium]
MKRKLLIIVVALMMLSGAVMGDIETRQRSIAESFFKEGVYYYNQQEYTAASNALIRSLSSDPTYYKARYWLGRAYYQSGYTKNALVEWERVLNLVGEDHLLKNKVTRLLYQTVGGQPKLPLEEKYLSTKGLYHPVRREITNPTSIYIDKSKLCWVVGYSTNNVISYDKNGNKMMALSPGDKGFKRPYDIVANSRGELYVSDFGNDRVVKFSNDGSYLSSVGRSGINNGEFYGPQGIALDKYDNLFVVDKGNHRVQKFNPQGDFLIEFGKEGRDRDNMLNPSDVLVVANKIYVTDTGNRRIQVFDLSGNWVKNLGEDVFVEPKGLKRVNDNEILVADKGLGVMKLGLNPLEIKVIKKTEHGLRSPVDIALDNNRFLYVADVNELDIRVYVPEKMKYSGLDISILQTFSPGYPDRGTLKWVLGLFTNAALSSGRVTHRVLVRDQQRNPIFGLNKENFKVFERGVIHSVNVLSEHTIKKKASVVILNERSYDMKRH